MAISKKTKKTTFKIKKATIIQEIVRNNGGPALHWYTISEEPNSKEEFPLDFFFARQRGRIHEFKPGSSYPYLSRKGWEFFKNDVYELLFEHKKTQGWEREKYLKMNLEEFKVHWNECVDAAYKSLLNAPVREIEQLENKKQIWVNQLAITNRMCSND